MDLAAAKRIIERHAQWHRDALKAAEQLLSNDHLQKLIGESWWRDQMNAPDLVLEQFGAFPSDLGQAMIAMDQFGACHVMEAAGVL